MSRKTLITLLAAFFVLATLAAADRGAAQPNISSSLTVRGEATLEVNADQFRCQIGVLSRGKTAAAALEANNRTMQALAAALRGIGLTPAEFETGSFLVQPRWSPRPKNAAPDWQPEIVGYQVNNSYRVKTTRLQTAGDIIATAIKAGANQVNHLYFTLADHRQHHRRAIAAATANAVADARELARAAGLELGDIITITLDPETDAGGRRVPRSYYNSLAKGAPGAGLELTPGKIPVRATVEITYAIKKRAD